MILRRWKKVPSGHRTGRDLVCVLLKTNTLPIYKFAQVQVDLPVILVLAVDIGADLGLCVFELLLHIRDECTARFTSECTIKQFRTDFGCTSDRAGDAWEFADGIGVEGSKGDGVVVVVEGSKKFFWTCIGFDLGDERIEGGIRIREPSHRWRTGRPCSRRGLNGSNWRDIEMNHKSHTLQWYNQPIPGPRQPIRTCLQTRWCVPAPSWQRFVEQIPSFERSNGRINHIH